MDDLRLGRLARALRHRLEIPQREVARRADTSQSALSRLDRGRFAGMTVGRIRRILAVYDAELVQYVRWRGGDIDRLLDRGHAELGEHVAALLESLRWTVVAEVSYSIFGERGSIDLLAWHPASRVLLVIEIKTELTSIKETLRRPRREGPACSANRVRAIRVGGDGNRSHARAAGPANAASPCRASCEPVRADVPAALVVPQALARGSRGSCRGGCAGGGGRGGRRGRGGNGSQRRRRAPIPANEP